MHSVFLDLRTLALVLLLVTTFLGGLMIYIWRVHKTYTGFNLWVTSNLTIASGFLLMLPRGIIPDFFTIIVANTIILGGVLLAFEGSRKFLGLRDSRFFSLSLLSFHAVLLAIFTYAENNVINRIVIISLCSMIVTARISFIFSRNQPPEKNFTYQFTGATNLAFCFLMLMRAILTYTLSDIKEFYTPDWIQSLSFMTFIVFNILWTFNYMILNNQRLQNDLQKTQSKLEKLAATDFLTGVNNSRRFFEISEAEINRARRFRHSLSAIMFDIDYFKNVNDTFGHAAGDAVLIKIAEICRIALRSIDITGRLGGEEFAVLLPHTKITGAKIAAEYLRSAIEDAEIEFSGEKIKITASFGIAELHDTDTQIKQVLDRADIALYQAKNNGRNQIVTDCAEKSGKLLAVA